MTTGSILLGISLLLALLAYLARPFFASSPARKESERMALLAQKDALLAQIKTLDFEYETGKLPDAAYREQRRRLIEAAALVLQQFDTAVATASDDAIDSKIEAAIANLRGTNHTVTTSCPACAGVVRQGDKFCAHCGTPLEIDAA